MDHRPPVSPVHGFPRQEYWSGLPFSFAGDLLHPGIKPPPPSWQADSSPLSSVQFSHSVMSNFLRPHGLQHSRPPCPSPTPRVYSNSCPLRQWCHPTISPSVIPFSSHLQYFPASGSFPMSQFLYQVAKVLEFQLQHQSFQRTLRTDFL